MAGDPPCHRTRSWVFMHVATVRRAIPVLALALAALTACDKDTEGASGVRRPIRRQHSPRVLRRRPTLPHRTAAPPRHPGAEPVLRTAAPTPIRGAGRPPAVHVRTSPGLRREVDTAAGTTHFQLVFQNTGDSTCTLTGFPGVSFRGRDGARIGNAAERDTDTAVTTVTLIPNAHAAADAQAPSGRSGYSDAECRLKSVSFLGVFPPGSRDQIDAPWKTAECGSSAIHGLKVGPVHPIR
ncbi:DUF4232 domain-containing protein [Streptomyces sp. T1317-0309]|nr:DUF4232 domain-containing protein [Streptomyces sp. T1317-0309]